MFVYITNIQKYIVKCKVSQQLLFEIKIIIKESRLKQFENIDGNIRIGIFVNNLVISQNKKRDIHLSQCKWLLNSCHVHLFVDDSSTVKLWEQNWGGEIKMVDPFDMEDVVIDKLKLPVLRRLLLIKFCLSKAVVEFV